MILSALLGIVSVVEAPQWPEVTQTAKPWVYNWWMASAVDEKGLEVQCAAMEEAGFGGFHVIPIYGAKGYEAKYRPLLSPKWIEAWNLAVRTARRHGLGVDLTMGSGWCFGGPWVTERDSCSSGMRVKRAGPGGRGYMIDPFSPQAMSNHVARFEAAFGRGGLAERPRAFYHDSYEYFGARPKKGGDAAEYLRQTFGVWTGWCRANGYLTRNEAHGSPGNWLDLYALSDMPETEMYGAHCRDVLISKFASSAAHVTGRRFVTSESGTWLGQHYGSTLADFKILVDRLFLSGVNHVFYHGLCYSPVEAAWPGWCFYAAAEMNPRNPIWRDVRVLNDYVARCQAVFQSAEPDEDTLVYWPFCDYPVGSDGTVGPMSVDNAQKWFHERPIGETARRLAAEGRAFDYVSDRLLRTADVSRYADIVVPPCTNMPSETKAVIARFVRKPVRCEPFPSKGLSFVRLRLGDSTAYFVANTNEYDVVCRVHPSAQGAKLLMDPMTGRISEACETPEGVLLELAGFESTILYVDGRRMPTVCSASVSHTSAVVPIDGPWELTPVCGGPVLPEPRRMTSLTTWSRTEDGRVNPFSGTMRYRTTFELPQAGSGEAVFDLGRVSQSARVRINGHAVGTVIMAPYRVRFDGAVLVAGRNELEVEVTSVGQNRLRQLGLDGVRWAYFEDANMRDFRGLYDPSYREDFDAATLPLADCGLFGPVRLWTQKDYVKRN